MADKPVHEVEGVDAALDALSSPSSSDVYGAVDLFSSKAVASVAAKRALAGGGGGSQPSPETVPVATSQGVTVDTTTWDDPILNDGSKMTVLVFPTDQTFVALAEEGMAFPFAILASDPTDGWYFAGGEVEPYANGNYISFSSSVVQFGKRVQLQEPAVNPAEAAQLGQVTPLVLPAADPHIAGALWNNGGTPTISAG